MKNSSLTLGVKNCVINGSSTRVFKYFNGALSCFNWMVANVWECAARECFFLLFCPFLFFLSMFCTNRTETLECVAVPFTFDWDFKEPRRGAIQITGKIWTRHKQMFPPRVFAREPRFWKKNNNVNVFSLGKKKKKRFVSCRLSEDAVQFCVILMNDCQFCCACVFFFVCLYLHSEIFWENSLAYLMFFLSACTLTPSRAATLGDETLITKSV